MILSGVKGARKQEFLSSPELAALACLEPMVLNQKYLNDHRYIPGTELTPALRKEATEIHRRLRSAFSDVDARGDKVIDLAAELLYIVRSNIAHGGKTAFGPDEAKSRRDESVCKATIPVQFLLIRGRVKERKGLQVFTWNPSGEEVRAKLFESTDLKGDWERIDRFEGMRYRRQLVLAKTPDAVCVANAYVES